jgi:hypothetical protein
VPKRAEELLAAADDIERKASELEARQRASRSRLGATLWRLRNVVERSGAKPWSEPPSSPGSNPGS